MIRLLRNAAAVARNDSLISPPTSTDAGTITVRTQKVPGRMFMNLQPMRFMNVPQ